MPKYKSMIVANPDRALAKEDLEEGVKEILAATPFLDIHTHLFAPGFGRHGLWGIDDLLTYHYLEAELFRFSRIAPDQYWALSKPEQADLVWRTLFVENVPISEATRGVIAALHALGLNTTATNLDSFREFFREQNLEDHVSRVFGLAGIRSRAEAARPMVP
jgi:hypothetical protein